MRDKMCNECKRCDGDLCTYFDNYSDRESTIACILFEPKKPTVFDYITQSEEKLAEKFVYKTLQFFYDDNHKPIPNHTYYVSQLLVSEKTGRSVYFENEEDAIAATIKVLKKEVKDEQE